MMQVTLERWFKLSFLEQMGNAGTDISRSIKWREKDPQLSASFLKNGLELLEFTIQDPKNKDCLPNLVSVQQELKNYFLGDNKYKSADEKWDKYFYDFAYAASLQR